MVTERKLVFEDQFGNVVRTFTWNGNSSRVVRRGDNRRLEIVTTTEDLEKKKIPFEDLGSLETDKIQSEPLLIGQLGQLKFVDNIDLIETDQKNIQTDDRTFRYSITATLLLFLGFISFIRNVPLSTQKLEEELKQQIVRIVKNVAPQEVSKNAISNATTHEVRESKQQKVSLKRMGALSALGSLSQSKQKSGLNLGAAQTTAGPGLGGTAGSGGIQTSVYAKGIVGAPLGAGGNIQGAGGYGTKGKGGGQAGYGNLSLVGSSGATSLPLGAEASVAKGLDRDQIAAVINRNLGQVRFCYEQGLQGNSNLNGRVAVDFVIGADGLVKSSSVESTTLNSKAVEDCIVLRLKSWRFPLPDGGVDVKVTYPFILRRAGQG